LVVGGREIVYHDSDITVYPASGKERLCSDGRHLIVVVNRHLQTVYEMGPADVPMLSNILNVAEQLLCSLPGNGTEEGRKALDLRVGFVGSVMRDPQSPHVHLHAHAMLGPVDTSLPGATFWRRNVVFGGLNWWSVDDLRAEIREETSNNRVKSGYADRGRAPIDKVPDAGSLAGLPNALDPDPYTDTPSGRLSPGLREEGEATPKAGPSTPRSDSGRTVQSPPVLVTAPDDEGYVAVDLREVGSSRR